MRKNQVTIKIQRFGDQVPKDYPEDAQEILVYADSNNLYEALAAAFSGVLEEVRKYENIPSFGCCDPQSNAGADPHDPANQYFWRYMGGRKDNEKGDKKE
ncbi:MAG: hypothetical protein E7518_00485 [Ruminococcaceae bacterium]|nr:hypothetical protein [Oscillospiraceae bacterium]